MADLSNQSSFMGPLIPNKKYRSKKIGACFILFFMNQIAIFMITAEPVKSVLNAWEVEEKKLKPAKIYCRLI